MVKKRGGILAILVVLGGMVPLIKLIGHYTNNGLTYIGQARVTITSPENGETMKDRGFAVSGTASHVPANSELWVVDWPSRQGHWYPVAAASLSGNLWSLPRKTVCPGNGEHYIKVFLVPDSQALIFNSYVQRKVSSGYNDNLGMGSIPSGITQEASSLIQVPPGLKSCAQLPS